MNVLFALPSVCNTFGLIHEMVELCVDPGEPNVFLYAARMADTTPFLGQRVVENCAGAGFSRETARMAALGECIERYAAVAYDPSNSLEVGSLKEIRRKHNVVDCRQWALFSESQYQKTRMFKPFDEDVVLHWLPAWSMTRDQPVYVPVQLVLMRGPLPGEPVLCEVTSTGLACGRTYAEAVLCGLLEVVERDAIMIYWLNRIAAPRFDISALNPLYETVFERPSLVYHVFDLTTDIQIPVAFCLLEDAFSGSAAFAAGASAHLGSMLAVQKALVEAVQTRAWLRQMISLRGVPQYRDDYHDVMDFDDHVRLFGDPHMRKHLGFLLDNPVVRSIPNELQEQPIEACLQEAVYKVHNVGLDVLVVDLTTDDIADLGFVVVRVLIPGAIPMNGSHGALMLGGARIYNVPVRLGFLQKPLAEAELNRVPHPFP